MTIVERPQYRSKIETFLEEFQVVALIGPRQCGKTTLAKTIPHNDYFDLENPRDLARLEHPQTTLEKLTGTIVIDEIQRRPDLFELLRYLVDSNPEQRYLILGSASPELVKNSSESLAGRVAFVELTPFSLEEVESSLDQLWLQGGYPRSLLTDSNQASLTWRENYIRTFLERDIPQLGIRVPANTLHRFWTMIAHYHGQVLNFSELGRSFGVNDVTVRRYLEILAGTFMIELLQPWHSNVKKRQVRSPKLYIRDSGIFHSLLQIESHSQLQSNPKLGASWEGFVVEQARRAAPFSHRHFYFWSVHSGSELDLFWNQRGKSFGIEVKYSDAPKLDRAVKVILKDLDLAHLWIIYPGPDSYPLSEQVTVIPVREISSCFQPNI